MIRRFLPKLLNTIKFDSNPARMDLLKAFDWIRQKPNNDPPQAIINKAWYKHIKQDIGTTNHTAFTFCALNQLQTALRRRDVFVAPSWRYSDPRAGLLTGHEWDVARPMICRSLILSAEPKETLSLLALELDQTYRAVAERLPDNQAVRFEVVDGKKSSF